MPLSIQLYLQVFIAESLVWFLLHYLCWALTTVLLGHPVVALHCGDSAALGLWESHLPELYQFIIDGMDIGVGNVLTLTLSLGGCRVGQPTSCPLSS